MAIVNEMRRRSGQVAIPIIGAALFGYFAYHTVLGDRGLLAYLSLMQSVETASKTLAHHRDVRDALQRRTQRLRPDGLDLDLLEERARAVLGRVRHDERVILDRERLAARS